MAVVTEQQYRVYTGDLRTSSAGVSGALAEATALVEERLCRPLEFGTYTETLEFIRGYLYPRATPLAIAADGFVDTATLRYTSAMLPSPYARTVTAVYQGGWTSATLPVTLRHAICQLARGLLESPPGDGMSLVGATSITVGDLAISYGKPSDVMWPSGIWAQVRRYAHREYANT